MITKTCTKCCDEKSLSEFPRRAGSKDGTRNECRACLKILKAKDYTEKKAVYLGRVKKRRGLVPGYRVWEGMIRRCYSEKHQAFSSYGGRGIVVCDAWRESSEGFLAWLNGNGWSRGLQLDRIDNDKGYCPENCRIVSSVVNNNNKRNNRVIFLEGESLTIAQAARKYGVGKTTIRERLNRGWPDHEAVSPVEVRA